MPHVTPSVLPTVDVQEAIARYTRRGQQVVNFLRQHSSSSWAKDPNTIPSTRDLLLVSEDLLHKKVELDPTILESCKIALEERKYVDNWYRDQAQRGAAVSGASLESHTWFTWRWKNVFENLKRCPHLLEDSELFRTVPEETKQPVAARNNLYTHLSGVGETHEASQGNEDSGDSASDHVGSNEKSTRTQPYLKVLISDDPLAQLIGRWHTERLRSELEGYSAICFAISNIWQRAARDELSILEASWVSSIIYQEAITKAWFDPESNTSQDLMRLVRLEEKNGIAMLLRPVNYVLDLYSHVDPNPNTEAFMEFIRKLLILGNHIHYIARFSQFNLQTNELWTYIEQNVSHIREDTKHIRRAYYEWRVLSDTYWRRMQGPCLPSGSFGCVRQLRRTFSTCLETRRKRINHWKNPNSFTRYYWNDKWGLRELFRRLRAESSSHMTKRDLFFCNDLLRAAMTHLRQLKKESLFGNDTGAPFNLVVRDLDYFLQNPPGKHARPLVVGVHLHLESLDVFLRSIRDPIKCFLEKSCHGKLLRFAKEIADSVHEVNAMKGGLHRQLYKEHFTILEAFEKELVKFTKNEHGLDLYHEAPMAVGQRVVVIQERFLIYGGILWNHFGFVGSLMHLYNALRQLDIVEEVPILNALCKVLQTGNRGIFPGKFPTSNFQSSHSIVVLGAKLERSGKGHGGKSRPKLELDSHIMRPIHGPAAKIQISDFSLLRHISQCAYQLENIVPNSRGNRLESISTEGIVPAAEKVGAKMGKEFAGEFPIGRINYFKVYSVAVRTLEMVHEIYIQENDESHQKDAAELIPLTVNFILEDLDHAVKFRQEGKGLMHKSFREIAFDYPSHKIFFEIADILSKIEHGSDMDYFLLKSI